MTDEFDKYINYMKHFGKRVAYGSRIGIRKTRRTLEFLTSGFSFPIRVHF